MAKLKVIVNEDRFIPGLGKGPFKKPVLIDATHYHNLKSLGYLVIKAKEDEVFEKELEEDKTLDNTPLETTKDVEVRDVEEVDEEELEEVVEEQDEAVEEELEADPEVEENSEEAIREANDEPVFSDMTVAQLKEELDELEVDYAHNARKADLVKLLEEALK